MGYVQKPRVPLAVYKNMFWSTLIFSQACSPNKEICLTPSVSEKVISIDITFTPFTGYLAFGYGGVGMTDESMVILMPSGTGFTADSYFSTTMSTPKKVANVWKVVSSSAGKVSISGFDGAFPKTGGQFSWASGPVTGGSIKQHADKVGTFKLEESAYKKASPSPSAAPVVPSIPVAAPSPTTPATSPVTPATSPVIPAPNVPVQSESPNSELSNIPTRMKCKSRNAYSPASTETGAALPISDIPSIPYNTQSYPLPTESGSSGYPSTTPGDIFASSSSTIQHSIVILLVGAFLLQ